MKKNGFAMTELVVVIAIIGTLTAMAGMAYTSWMSKYRFEGQVREMYIDLLNARTQAMQLNRIYFVTISADNYSVIEDTNDSGGAVADSDDKIRLTKQLRFPSNWVNTVSLNAKGLVSSPSATVTFNSGGVDGQYDCIALSLTRITMGRLNGTTCVPQ